MGLFDFLDGGIGKIVGSVAGGLLGGSSKGASTTQQAQIDPRIGNYLYGTSEKPGILNNAYDLWNSQSAQGGLNDYQRAGLESQRQVLTNPGYTAGYEQQRQLGMGLLGAGVAANPFNTGQMQLMTSGGLLGGGASQQPQSTGILGYTPQSQQTSVIAPQQSAYVPMQTDNSALAAMNTPIGAYTPPAAPVAAAPAAAAAEAIDPMYRSLFGHLLGSGDQRTPMFDAAIRDYQSSMSGGG